MIDLISTPESSDTASPPNVCRWIATESPNNFRLLRHDFDIVTAVANGLYLRITVAIGTYNGTIGNVITVYNKTLNAMFTGIVQAGTGVTTIETNIPFVAGFDPTDTALDPDRLITYVNDMTLHGGYYFEGRLTINGVLHSLSIIASPDSFGYADLDVSGILRIVTSIGKTGDYTDRIMKEPTKSGNFMFEYRECWYGSSESYTWEPNLWWYGEGVRSEEQGSSLCEYVSTDTDCAPFFNQFAQPVYFSGLPFDLSFILPEQWIASPSIDLSVTIISYDSEHNVLSTVVETVSSYLIDGYICSLTIRPSDIAAGAAYFTAEISN